MNSMSKLCGRISFGAVLLLVPPLIVLAAGWHWLPTAVISGKALLYTMTQTVSRPWGLVSSLLLFTGLIFAISHHISVSKWRWALLAIIVVWGGQGIKSLLKPYFQEPRPYVVALMAQEHQQASEFYRLSKTQRSEVIQQRSENWPLIPDWQRSHWQHELGYSFPSGHSLFVSCWVLFFYAVLSLQRRWGCLLLVTAWAWMVMWSRMALGMHWPQDVIASVIIAWVFTMLCMNCYYVYFMPKESEE